MFILFYNKSTDLQVGGTSSKIPAEEEVMATKAWLKRYSLKKLKIDLPHIFQGELINKSLPLL